jgi:hypothetical protein
MECITCHQPHDWKVDQEAAKETCTMCHDYKDPDTFLQR